MSKIDSYKRFLSKPDRSITYWTEGAVLDFTEELATILKQSGMTRTDLAQRIGTSKSYITKVFSGEANFTLETMAKFALAVDHAVRVHLAPLGMHTVWIDRRIDDAVVTYNAPATVENIEPTQAPKFSWQDSSSNA